MKKQTYQMPEIRDASNNIVQSGTYGRYTPLTNADNTGVLDYVNNNLEALHDAQTSGNGVRAGADSNGVALDVAALKKLIADSVAQAKKEALLEAHPVGSYYFSDESTNPGDIFGGTWEALTPGMTLIAQGKGTDTFGSFEFVAGQTYGERMHQLTVDESAKHSHQSGLGWGDPKTYGTTELSDTKHGRVDTNQPSNGWSTSNVGQDKPHNNIQPSKATYIWFRTA